MPIFIFSPTTSPVFKSYLTFMGVARFKEPRTTVGYQGAFTPKPLPIVSTITIDESYPAGGPAPLFSIFEKITDYAFELHQVKITYQTAAGTILDPTVPHCRVQWFDPFRNATSNLPLLDTHLNGAPDSRYENGAIEPPMVFPQQTYLHMDLYSLLSGSQVPLTAVVEWVGLQRFPC